MEGRRAREEGGGRASERRTREGGRVCPEKEAEDSRGGWTYSVSEHLPPFCIHVFLRFASFGLEACGGRIHLCPNPAFYFFSASGDRRERIPLCKTRNSVRERKERSAQEGGSGRRNRGGRASPATTTVRHVVGVVATETNSSLKFVFFV